MSRSPPERFAFPFPPYAIQQQFMRKLYDTLENGNVGIFESPTGTGKSLSLICGALTWLEAATQECSIAEPPKRAGSGSSEMSGAAGSSNQGGGTGNSGDMPSWISDFDADAMDRKLVSQRDRERREKLAARLAEIRRSGASLSQTLRQKRHRRPSGAHKGMRISPLQQQQQQQQQQLRAGISGDSSDGDELTLEEYHSEKSGTDTDASSDSDDSGADDSESEQASVTKIIFASRTHSQLSQFVAELKKTEFGERITCVQLGSRRALCVHPQVSHYTSDVRMNDRCLELQHSAASKKVAVAASEAAAAAANRAAQAQGIHLSRALRLAPRRSACPYYDASSQRLFREHLLSAVRDVEEAKTLGEESGCCSYYGSRKALPVVQVVAVPYSMVLHRGTRESMGLTVRNNVVIFDEAHNIVEAINGAYGVTLRAAQVIAALSQLHGYRERYRHRLSAKNGFYVGQILRILRALSALLRHADSDGNGRVVKSAHCNAQADAQEGQTQERVLTIHDFLCELRMENINLLKIGRYIERSQITKKLCGFAERQAQVSVQVAHESSPSQSDATLSPAQGGTDDSEYVGKQISPLGVVHRFLQALTVNNADGRVIVSPAGAERESGELVLRFVMLNPAVHFRELVDEARSVILAGGTMHPIPFVRQQLFAHLESERVNVFSCGHIVPSENLLGLCVGTGPTGVDFDFRFSSRNSPRQMDELGKLVVNVCTVVPGGVVVFVPSYAYLDTLNAHWQQTGVITRIERKKKVFREPRQAAQLQQTLQHYGAACCPVATEIAGGVETQPLAESGASKSTQRTSVMGGAMLLSVVGGKMSEGINFCDDLARVVVMVGLPYPNARSAELKEKMTFLDLQGAGRGRQYYENLCMRAVNQSIGRAIRHGGDYASILLVDHRFGHLSVRSQLPGWIQDRLEQYPNFSRTFGALIRFFRSVRARKI